MATGKGASGKAPAVAKNTAPAPTVEPRGPKAAPVTKLEPEVLEAITAKVVQVVAHQEMHSGPLPSPRQLEAYERAFPGTRELILQEYKLNGEHVRDMERSALRYQKSDNNWNRICAFALVLLSLGATVALSLHGHDWVAGCLALTTVGAVITGFLNQRSLSARDASPDDGEGEAS